MPTNSIQLLRRQFLRTGLINGLALLAGVSVLAGKGVASGIPEANAQLGINVLI